MESTYEIYERLRNQRGLKDADVYKATGLSQVMFSEWKKGKANPKIDKLEKIADFFGVTVDYLRTGEVKEGYYLNHETAEVDQEIFENKELRLLFDAAKDASPEDLQTVHQMLLALKRKERNEG